jgi:hypothetical protein
MNMQWALWLIILIPVGVSILSLLFRTREDPRRGGAFRPNRPGMGGPRPARRSVSDIDQFLEEINRRRREAAERRKATDPLAVPAPPPPVARPAPPVPRSKPPRRPDRDVKPPRQRPRISEPEPVVAEAVPVYEPAPPLSVPQEPAAIPAAPSTTRPRVLSPAVAQALPLLRSNQGLRTAIVLQEIFGKPLARRSRSGFFSRLV